MRITTLSLTVTCVAILMTTSACSDTPTGPSVPFQVSLTPAVVPSGLPSEGMVSVSAPVRGTLHIDLSSSDAVASVPSSITLPGGTSRATFRITTRVVAADTVARISVVVGDTTQEVALQVLASRVTQ